MTTYAIDLSTLTPDAASAALAHLVSAAPRVTCPECGNPARTYIAAGATLIEYHRAGPNWEWCNGSDMNMSEADE
jgi:hypothetical protein